VCAPGYNVLACAPPKANVNRALSSIVGSFPEAAPHLAGPELGWNISLDRLTQEVES